MKTLIGLEIHTQLSTKTKMFCGCANVSSAKEPNLYVCPVCLGMPGVLPVTNQKAVQMAVRAGLALGSEIADFSKFDRKNYFYPDLPKGYQISQFDQPICLGGELKIATKQGQKNIRLIRIHLEEDAAKVTHPTKSDYSLIDFNRAGTPLIESVTEPDMSSPEEARFFAEKFRSILRYLGVSSADMEKGQLRVDANINVVALGGRKTPISEIKNMNSFRAIERAMRYEEVRHKKALESHEEGEMIKETRGWVESKGETVSQRSKEESSDYRYFPEPDLPPLALSHDYVEKIRRRQPELPDALSKRLQKEYGLNETLAELLVSDKQTASYFENVASELMAWLRQDQKKVDAGEVARLYKGAADLILGDLTSLLKKGQMRISEVRITPENFAELIKMRFRGELSSSAMQTVLADMFLNGADPSDVAKERNLLQVSDTADLGAAVDKVLGANNDAVSDFKAGKQQALQFLMGMVMKETKGQANPEVVKDLLQEKIK